jgi:hypothetical protein
MVNKQAPKQNKNSQIKTQHFKYNKNLYDLQQQEFVQYGKGSYKSSKLG